VGAAVGLGVVGAVVTAVGLGVGRAVAAAVGLDVVFPGVPADSPGVPVGAAVLPVVIPAVGAGVPADGIGVASALYAARGTRVAVDPGSDETGSAVTIRQVKRTPQETLHSMTAVMSAIASMVARALRVIGCPFPFLFLRPDSILYGGHQPTTPSKELPVCPETVMGT
jgi:hypothetical protein